MQNRASHFIRTAAYQNTDLKKSKTQKENCNSKVSNKVNI